MFWTAFVWGLGASFGASIGLMSFVVMKCVWDWATNTKAAKQMKEIHEMSVAALTRRNELTEEQIGKLDKIACAIIVMQEMHAMKEQ